MSSQRQQLESAIAALQAQRELLGDEVTEIALATLRAKLAALADAPATNQTLRQVTILFLDVVGSTSLAQRLDAEDVHAAIDGLLADCTVIVEKHQGNVLQYAGDNLLAVFGAGAAHEDDAERAVHAGLALLAEGRRHAEQIAQRHGHSGMDVRVGVHTGKVLLGGGVDAEHTIRGTAVHIAARMEQTAPPGALRISHDTYRHVRGVFDAEAQAPIGVKGVDEPLATYLVHRAKPRAFRVATRGIEGVETRMIGRDAELAQLQDAFLRVCSERRLVCVSVVGDAGVGKSRLLYEFENWAEARPEAFCIFQGRAHPQTQNQPYGLLRDVLAWRFEIADSDSMADAKQKFERGIVPLFESDDGADMALAQAHVLGHLIGLDFGDSRYIRGIQEDVRQIRNRGFHAAAQVLRRFASRHACPVVLLLDDLHFADDASLDFLRTLEQLNRDVPILMLGLARPTLFERRADDSVATHTAQRIELAPLAKSASRSLVSELLKKLDEVPAALRELVTGGGEGNPFYMEELVKMLVDVGAIDVRGERWAVVPDRLVATRVPQTLAGVVQARLDELRPDEKLALQQASVIGLLFWDQALAAVDPRSIGTLPALVRRGLVVPRQEASFDGVGEFAFSHQILHQVTYDTVLKRDRREAHAKTAAWLAGRTGVRANDFLGVIGEHFESAGEHRQAAEFLARAAEHAKDRHAHAAAGSYATRALELLDRDLAAAQPPAADRDTLRLRWRLLDARVRAVAAQGLRSQQRIDIDALQRVAEALGDEHGLAVAAWHRGHLAQETADFRTQVEVTRQAIALAERAGDIALALQSQQLLAVATFMLGDASAGKRLAQEGLAAARTHRLRLVEGMFLNTLSIIAAMQDDLMATFEMDQQQLSIATEVGDARGEAITLGNLGLSWLNLGAHNEAREHLSRSLAMSQAVGDRLSESNTHSNLSKLAMHRGEPEPALAHAKRALEIALAAEDPRTEVFARCALGRAALALGRPTDAAAAFERAHEQALLMESGTRFDAGAGLALAVLELGDSAKAIQWVEDLLSHLAGGGTLDGAEEPRLVQLSAYRVLASAADERRCGLLADAYRELQSRAASITDAALRESFLTRIPENRQIAAAWEAECGRRNAT